MSILSMFNEESSRFLAMMKENLLFSKETIASFSEMPLYFWGTVFVIFVLLALIFLSKKSYSIFKRYKVASDVEDLKLLRKSAFLVFLQATILFLFISVFFMLLHEREEVIKRTTKNVWRDNVVTKQVDFDSTGSFVEKWATFKVLNEATSYEKEHLEKQLGKVFQLKNAEQNKKESLMATAWQFCDSNWKEDGMARCLFLEIQFEKKVLELLEPLSKEQIVLLSGKSRSDNVFDIISDLHQFILNPNTFSLEKAYSKAEMLLQLRIEKMLPLLEKASFDGNLENLSSQLENDEIALSFIGDETNSAYFKNLMTNMGYDDFITLFILILPLAFYETCMYFIRRKESQLQGVEYKEKLAKTVIGGVLFLTCWFAIIELISVSISYFTLDKVSEGVQDRKEVIEKIEQSERGKVRKVYNNFKEMEIALKDSYPLYLENALEAKYQSPELRNFFDSLKDCQREEAKKIKSCLDSKMKADE